MVSVTTDAHAQYHLDGDHERLFDCCATHVSGFMTAMARYLAAHASLVGPHRPGGSLDQTLSQLELLKWSTLFQDDLTAFNRRLDDWMNLDDIHFLNRHFERLLFEVGVLPDQLNDGSLYIHISGELRLASRQ